MAGCENNPDGQRWAELYKASINQRTTDIAPNAEVTDLVYSRILRETREVFGFFQKTVGVTAIQAILKGQCAAKVRAIQRLMGRPVRLRKKR